MPSASAMPATRAPSASAMAASPAVRAPASASLFRPVRPLPRSSWSRRALRPRPLGRGFSTALGTAFERAPRRLIDRLALDAGSATLEFLSLGVLLLVPVAYGALSLASVQQAMMAGESVARNAARSIAEHGPALGGAYAQSALELALADHGIPVEDADAGVSCEPVPADCTAPDTIVTVVVGITARLPLVPASLDPDATAGIRVEERASFAVSRFGAS